MVCKVIIKLVRVRQHVLNVYRAFYILNINPFLHWEYVFLGNSYFWVWGYVWGRISFCFELEKNKVSLLMEETPQKTPKHAKARFRDVFHHPGVVRSRVGASLSLRSSLGNVLTHVTSRKARKLVFHSSA